MLGVVCEPAALCYPRARKRTLLALEVLCGVSRRTVSGGVIPRLAHRVPSIEPVSERKSRHANEEDAPFDRRTERCVWGRGSHGGEGSIDRRRHTSGGGPACPSSGGRASSAPLQHCRSTEEEEIVAQPIMPAIADAVHECFRRNGHLRSRCVVHGCHDAGVGPSTNAVATHWNKPLKKKKSLPSPSCQR